MTASDLPQDAGATTDWSFTGFASVFFGKNHAAFLFGHSQLQVMDGNNHWNALPQAVPPAEIESLRPKQ
jgi:hypothetical protein